MSNSYEFSDFTLFREKLETVKLTSRNGDMTGVLPTLASGLGRFIFDEYGEPVREGREAENKVCIALTGRDPEGRPVEHEYRPLFLADPKAGRNEIFVLSPDGTIQKRQISEKFDDTKRQEITDLVRNATPELPVPKPRSLFERFLGLFGYVPARMKEYDRNRRVRSMEKLHALENMGVAPKEGEKERYQDIWDLTPEQKAAYLRDEKLPTPQSVQAGQGQAIKEDEKHGSVLPKRLQGLNVSMMRAVQKRRENANRIKELFLQANDGKGPAGFRGGTDQLFYKFAEVKNARLAEVLAQRSPEEIGMLINNACQVVGDSDMKEIVLQVERDLEALEKQESTAKQAPDAPKQTFEDRLIAHMREDVWLQGQEEALLREFTGHLMQMSRNDPKLKAVPMVIAQMEPKDAADLYMLYKQNVKHFDETMVRYLNKQQAADKKRIASESRHVERHGKYTVTAGEADPYKENLKEIAKTKLP